MDKVGVSFRSLLSSAEVRGQIVGPLRAAVERDYLGVYSNHLCQVDADHSGETEHLLVFEVHDFKTGLRALRMAVEELGPLEGLALHNLNPSPPPY